VRGQIGKRRKMSILERRMRRGKEKEEESIV